MNYLFDDGFFPFDFFIKEAFARDEVTDMIINRFMDASEYFKNDVPVYNIGRLANQSVHMFKMGVIARIAELEEPYGGFMWDESCNHFARRLYYEHDGEWDDILDEFDERLPMFSMDKQLQETFQQDMSKALMIRNIFFVDSEVDYSTLHFFADMKNYASPFSEEAVNRWFKNIPIVRVW